MPSLLCQDLLHREQWSLVFHPRGTLLVLELITLVQPTPALWCTCTPCGLDYDFFPLRLFDGDGFSDVLTAYGSSLLAATFLVSSPEEYSCAEFSGRSLPETFPYSALFGSTVDTCLSQLTRCVVRWCPQLHHIEGRRLPFRAAETDPHSLACSEDHGDSADAVCFLVVAVLLCRSCLLSPLLSTTGAHGPDSAEFVEVPQSQFLRLWTSLYCAATSCLATVKVPLIQFIAGVSGHFSRPQRQVRTVSAVHGGPGGDEG